MTQYFGIYVGNSSASIALYKDDKVDILTNDAGDRVTPAVVRISNKEQVVGTAAVASLSSKASSTVQCNKTFLDCSLPEEDFNRVESGLAYKIERDDKQRVTYILQDDEKTLKTTPVQVATHIFKSLLNIGKSAVPGLKELSCVICIPRHWDSGSRSQVLKAAEDAGWKVLQLISEAPAATLAYRLDTTTSSMNVLVYRLGGVSCDATIVEFEKGYMSVVSAVRSDSIGAQQFIDVLKKYLASEFRRKFHLDPQESRKSMSKLAIAAESIFQSLSTLTSCSKFVESVCEGIDFSLTVSRARLEAIINPLLQQIVQPIQDAIVSANLDTSQINKVVLCGAPLKMPKLVSYVTSLFPSGVEVLQSISPDEVLATGAAFQASYFSTCIVPNPVLEPTLRLPFLSAPLHVQFNDDEEIILKEMIVPCSRSISLPISDGTLKIKAEQFLENGGSNKGEAVLNDFSVPTVLEIQIKCTLENELVIEALDSTTDQRKKVSVEFDVEE